MMRLDKRVIVFIVTKGEDNYEKIINKRSNNYLMNQLTAIVVIDFFLVSMTIK